MEKTITLKQANLLKKNIDKMSRSEEQFIFMLFKNLNGIDNITQYSYNIPQDKLSFYLKEAINSGRLRSD